MIELYGKQNVQWEAAAVEEIKGALKSSARKKVAGLQEDKWMFEREGEKK
jgi:hypothetical protein